MARKEISIMTGVFEYLPRVLSEMEKSIKTEVKIRILLLDTKKLRSTNNKVQGEVIRVLKNTQNVEFRFCDDMPLRGTTVDSRKTIFSVDERKYLPLQKESGITENESMAKALNIYFESLWGRARPKSLRGAY